MYKVRFNNISLNFKFKSTLLLLFLSLSINAQEYSGKGKDINIILNNINEFSNSYITADYERLTTFYSEDAKIFPDGSEIIIGHDAIMEKWTISKGSKILSHKITPREIKIVDDFAYDYGYYEGSSSNKDGEVSFWKGKYVIVWIKIDDNWKIYLDIWNRINDKK